MDLPDVIPVFPLSSVILLPRSNLPLNVFEPRYLSMVDKAIAGNRLIAMIQPATGIDTSLSPEPIELRRTGCLGRITEFSEMDDGRVLITLTGICRFETLEEQETAQPYRSFKIHYNNYENDLSPGLGEDEVNRDMLLNVLKTYLEFHELDADWESIHSSSSEFLVNTLSMISPYGTEEKQALLESKDLKSRSEILIALAEIDIATSDENSTTSLQ